MGGKFYPDSNEEVNCLDAWVSQSFKTSNTFLKYGALRTSKEKDTSESDAELLSKRCMFMRPRNDFCRCNVCEQCFEHFLKNHFLLLGRYK